jgi:hypothetical protein
MADGIRATPYRYASAGAANDIIGGLLGYLRDPRRTQQMQGLAGLLESTGIPKTVERLAYGEPLTNLQQANVPTLRPETADALMTLLPNLPITGKAIQATKGLPVGMSIKDVSKTSIAPQSQAINLAEQRAQQLGQSVNPETRMLQQGYEQGWYHGSTGDIKSFDKGLLGESTGAESAKKGFFFARDPQNPPASMLQKSNDPASIQMLKKLGMSEEEISKLNTVSMAGHGAETAVGYAKMGGSREYKNAMRQAKSAEKRGNWDEYEKQMAIAEDSAIKRNQDLQSLVASYGDKRDVMLDEINKAFLNKNLPQEEAIALDQQLKKLMPDYWYTKDPQKHLPVIKENLIKNVGQDKAKPALNAIDDFMKNYNERMLMEHTEEGSNVMPVALRYENPLVYDFQGSTYRDQTYADLIDQALREGRDAVILKNTFDPGAGPSKLIDVGVVFEPDQVRSKFAAFDPLRKTAAIAASAGLAAPDLLAQEVDYTLLPPEKKEELLRSLLGQ